MITLSLSLSRCQWCRVTYAVMIKQMILSGWWIAGLQLCTVYDDMFGGGGVRGQGGKVGGMEGDRGTQKGM